MSRSVLSAARTLALSALVACGASPGPGAEGAKAPAAAASADATTTPTPTPDATATPAPAPAPPPEPSSTTATTGAAGAPKSRTASRISARHVLIQYMGAERAPSSVVRTKEQARVVAQQVLQRARAGEEVARLAVEYSDEPGAAARGGSLGRFGRGQMVGAFEEAAFRLNVGEVSDVVESPFGFHVIQRTE